MVISLNIKQIESAVISILTVNLQIIFRLKNSRKIIGCYFFKKKKKNLENKYQKCLVVILDQRGKYNK